MPAPEINSFTVRAACPTSEYDEVFIRGMVNRMAVSFHKYGYAKDAAGSVDFLGCAELRVQKYHETKNTEFLIDAANFYMMEFMFPSLEGASFEGTDSDASPGRVRDDGTVNAERN